MSKETQETQEVLFGDTVETDLFGNEIDLEDDEFAVEEPEQKEEVETPQKKVEQPKSEEEEIIFVENEEEDETLRKKEASGSKKKEAEEEEGSEKKKEVEEEGGEATSKKEKKSEEEEEEGAAKKGDDAVDWDGIYNQMVASGEWEAVEIKGEDKTIDKETFLQISKEQKKARIAKEKEEVLNVLSDDEKEYLEYKKNGGNLSAFVKTFNFKQQAENLDISTEQGQKNAVYAYYKNVVKWKDDRIQKHIGQLEKDLELEDEAKMAKGEIETITAEDHKTIKEKAKADAERKQLAEQKFVETAKATLKEGGFDTKTSNLIVRDFTDRDERKLTAIDKKFLELRNNPDEMAELWSFLMDKDKFIEKVSQKKVNESELDSFTKIQINKSKSKKKASLVDSEDQEGETILTFE